MAKPLGTILCLFDYLNSEVAQEEIQAKASQEEAMQ